jgi:DNA invertase Pin-like site-specific DNA recombinase
MNPRSLLNHDTTKSPRYAVYIRTATVPTPADRSSRNIPYKQMARCDAIARKKFGESAEHVELFSDLGCSGLSKATTRRSWRSLMRSAKLGRFDAVVVSEMDRLARCRTIAKQMIEDLESLKITIHAENYDPEQIRRFNLDNRIPQIPLG